MEVAPRIVGDTEVCEQLRTSNARDFGLGEQLAYMEELQRIAEWRNWWNVKEDRLAGLEMAGR